MTTQFAEPIDSAIYQDPSAYSTFFSKANQDVIANYDYREHPPIADPHHGCDTNLFLGFFMDGTRNNYGVSEQAGDHSHSNVARLFDAYQGQAIAPLAVMPHLKDQWPGVEDKYPHFFRIYSPGVGSPFAELGDNGTGIQRIRGSAFAWAGQVRLVWALAQALNCVHRYIHRVPLLNTSQIRELHNAVMLTGKQLDTVPLFHDYHGACQPLNTQGHLLEAVRKLHRALGGHMPDPQSGQVQIKNPGIIRNIYVSIFGFSRGAAAARALANWLHVLCRLDARERGVAGLTLGGFAVHFEFMGLFDTVASVGNAALYHDATGHQAWADAQRSLRVPEGLKCLHLVAAHELRRSFPLDSISVDGQLPANSAEIVFPGVHSDVGGGYAPGEQGRGLDSRGADLLSRIPLAVMYRAARLSGVPLKLERAIRTSQDRFRIDGGLIAAFNDYVRASAAFEWPPAPAVDVDARATLERLKEELRQARKAREEAEKAAQDVDKKYRMVGWNYGRDHADRTRQIREAQERVDEARAREEALQAQVDAGPREIWRSERALVRGRTEAAARGAPLRALMRHHMQLALLWRKLWAGRVAEMASVRRAPQVDRNDLLGADRELQAEIGAFERWLETPPEGRTQIRALFESILGAFFGPIFGPTYTLYKNYPAVDPDRFAEWCDLEGFWHVAAVPAAIDRLLQDYVHDSRAWFKLWSLESAEVEPWLKEEVERYKSVRHLIEDPHNIHANLTRAETLWIEHYMRTGKVPEMPTPGREPFTLGAGYLRFRRVYAGASNLRLTRSTPAGEVPDDTAVV